MRTISLILIFVVACAVFVKAQLPQNYKNYTLSNGLTVFLLEDHNKPQVFGAVMVKAGSKDDPDDATGMAHYMEHMMFKGTTSLGTVSWEKEKPHIDKIFSLYDDLATQKEDTARKKIQMLINEESLKAAEYAIPNELSNILNEIGGTNMNAGTGPDFTVYYNAFPPNMTERWLELYSHRFEEPVFRGFQAELEVVYEEKNMYADMFIFSLIEKFNKNFFKNHPYGQKDRIGTIEQLKNPSLTKMYKFMKDWYVANNMALVVVGDFKTDEIIPLIEDKFGDWERKELPERKVYNEEPFNGREFIEDRLSPIKMGLFGFRTVTEAHEDYIALDVCNRILANSNQTGLLDKLMLDGDVLAAQVMPMPYNDHGATLVLVVPKIIGQDLEDAEKLVFDKIKLLKEGNFEDWMLDAIKKELYVNHEQSLESMESKAMTIASVWAQGREVEDFYNYPARLNAITKEDIIRVANKYYGDNYLALFSKMGFKKNEKIEKPGFEPLVANTNAKSEFAKRLEVVPESKADIRFIDFKNDFTTTSLQPGVTLYTTPNPLNEVFSLELKYGVGDFEMPLLEYASQMMNVAGVKDADVAAFKSEMGRIGCTYSVSSDDSYLYVEISGLESNLRKAIILLNRLLVTPELDKEKLKILTQGAASERKMERSEPDNVASALFEYVRYGEKSTYIDRLTLKEIGKLEADTLVARFKEALKYELEIHYVGKKEEESVKKLLMENLTLESSPLKTKSPVIRDSKAYGENTVFFVDKKKSLQSKIFLYTKCESYKKEQDPVIEAFNTYFGGGFSGLVLQEVREYRSLAYSAGASYSSPRLEGANNLFVGYVGTQSDKTIEALTIFDDLIRNMPEKKERMDMIKKYLVQSAMTDQPGFREISTTVARWKQKGYKDDPRRLNIPVYEQMEFDDILKLYKKNIKEAPFAIAFVGDAKRIDMKEVEKYGKIVKVKESSLFK